MGEGWYMSEADAARYAQDRRDWTDRALLAHLLLVARQGEPGPQTPDEAVLLQAIAQTDGDDAAKAAAVAGKMPRFWGYFGTLTLEDALGHQPDLTDAEVEAVLAVPGYVPARMAVAAPPPTPPAPGPVRRRVPRSERRQAAVLVLGALAAMLLVAVAWVLVIGG